MSANHIETNSDFLAASMKERILFSYFQSVRDDFNIVRFSKYNDKRNHWDVSFISGGCKYIAEIKCRTYSSYDWPDWIIEEHKWDDLNEVRNKVPQTDNIKILYINIYPDDVLSIWQLDDIDRSRLKFKKRKGRKKTCGQDNSEGWHYEYFLPNSLTTYYRCEFPNYFELKQLYDDAYQG